jgi:hypothetical protein
MLPPLKNRLINEFRLMTWRALSNSPYLLQHPHVIERSVEVRGTRQPLPRRRRTRVVRLREVCPLHTHLYPGAYTRSLHSST